MLTFKLPLFIILPISQSRFHQMIKKKIIQTVFTFLERPYFCVRRIFNFLATQDIKEWRGKTLKYGTANFRALKAIKVVVRKFQRPKKYKRRARNFAAPCKTSK